MDASDLKIFEAVVRAGNITKAAASLHTVQSNVTTRIRLLEDELGVPLFHRHARGVLPTVAAQRLLPYAVRVAQLLAQAKGAVDENAEPQGRLVIGTLETTAAIRLPPILTTYNENFPQVDLTIRTGTTCELIDEVLQHRVEGAFVVGPVNHPDLIEETMFSEEMVIIAPKAKPVLEMFAGDGAIEILVFRVGCSYRVRLESILSARGIDGLVRRFELGTLEGIIGLVSAGIGISLLPRVSVLSAWREGRVAIQELPPEQSRADTVFIRRRDAFHSSTLTQLIKIAKDVHIPIKDKRLTPAKPRAKTSDRITNGSHPANGSKVAPRPKKATEPALLIIDRRS